ncbi:MAG: FliH/SctL family protein [Paludibaculum sp.]
MASKIRPANAELVLPVLEWPRVGDPVNRPEPTPGRPQEPSAQPAQSAERQKAEIQKMVDQQVQARLQAERQESFRQGEAAGRQKAAAETEALVERMARSIEETAGMKGRLRRQAERDVVALALAMARRVLRRQIVIDEEALLGLVKAAFENVSLREVTEVRVHPQFAARLQGHLSRIGAPKRSASRATRVWRSAAWLWKQGRAVSMPPSTLRWTRSPGDSPMPSLYGRARHERLLARHGPPGACHHQQQTRAIHRHRHPDRRPAGGIARARCRRR